MFITGFTVCVLILLVVVVVFGPSWFRRKTYRLVCNSEDAQLETVVRAAASTPFWLSGCQFVLPLAEVLAACGRRAVAIRVWTGDSVPEPVVPLDVPFEPRPVDETAPAFRSLATTATDDAEDKPVAGAGQNWREKSRRVLLWCMPHAPATIIRAVVCCVAIGWLTGGPGAGGRRLLLFGGGRAQWSEPFWQCCLQNISHDLQGGSGCDPGWPGAADRGPVG